MKPDWDKLVDAFTHSKTALIADVDCTAEGKSLCEENGVRGYPSIKYGDPSALEDYQGGRDYESLKTFADENLKPMCFPTNINLCGNERKAEIKKFQDMADDDLKKIIKEKEMVIADAEKTFKEEVQKLQDEHSKLSSEKVAKLEEIKKSGLGLMKAVQEFKKADVKDEL
jgi:hypothetical protein